MTRPPVSEAAVEDLFYECLRGTGRGLTYGKVVTAYAARAHRTERTAKAHLKLLVAGITAGRVKSVARYRGPEGWLYGCADDDAFVQAKEDAERPPPFVVPREQSLAGLGGPFQNSPVNSNWETCPVKNRIVRATVITMGVADFMECPLCNRAHFLGVSPKMKGQRLYAWQVDPLANAEEYADAITHGFMGDPKTQRAQPSRLNRIREGGHYVGLWFRTSWDYDPMARLNEAMKKGNRRGQVKRNPKPTRAGRNRPSTDSPDSSP